MSEVGPAPGDSNRAPLIIGNHFEGWNAGIYMTAVEQVMRRIVRYSDSRTVSFRQLVDVSHCAV